MRPFPGSHPRAVRALDADIAVVVVDAPGPGAAGGLPGIHPLPVAGMLGGEGGGTALAAGHGHLVAVVQHAAGELPAPALGGRVPDEAAVFVVGEGAGVAPGVGEPG